MKRIKLFFTYICILVFFTSCYTEVIEDTIVEQPQLSVNNLLEAYDLWYVDINQTKGFGETLFLQQAFTLSFIDGTIYANNNLVGIGEQGDGFGVSIANYEAYNMVLDVNHVLDGFSSFDIYTINSNTIELYNPATDTSYFLIGHQRATFDYNSLFYDNITYFLQEYDAWEKTYTSRLGAINEFDNENYLAFLETNNDSQFLSAQATNVTHVNTITWNFTGVYNIQDVAGTNTVKSLTLNYDFFDNDFFELSVINESNIALYHVKSRTTYEFQGVNYIPFLKTVTTNKAVLKTKEKEIIKKRKLKSKRVKNPRSSTRL